MGAASLLGGLICLTDQVSQKDKAYSRTGPSSYTQETALQNQNVFTLSGSAEKLRDYSITLISAEAIRSSILHLPYSDLAKIALMVVSTEPTRHWRSKTDSRTEPHPNEHETAFQKIKTIKKDYIKFITHPL